MAHRTRLRLLLLGFVLVPIGSAWVAHTLNASEGVTSLSAFGSGVAYFIFALIKMRCPRCNALPHLTPCRWPLPILRFPTHCDTCNLDFTRPQRRPQV